MSKASDSIPFPGTGRAGGDRRNGPKRSKGRGWGGRGDNGRRGSSHNSACSSDGRRGGEDCILVCADGSGAFGDEPGFVAAFRSGNTIRMPRAEELSPLPEDASLQFLPGRRPLAWPRGGVCRPDNLRVFEDALVLAAQLPSGWTRTLLPAWQADRNADILPIFGYTAVFCRGGRLWCAAVRTENNPRWRPSAYALPELGECIAEVKKDLPGNRLLEQLEICACQYGCYNAQNIFYGRWEGACPVSPQCNAGCIGCISKQPDKEAPPSPQIRLNFVPTAEEICELGLYHIGRAERAIFTFGQGCEGEPLLQAPRIAEAIAAIRNKTDEGTLHMNSNGSRPEGAELLFKAGLNSIRVSMCSAVESTYNSYYRPRNYKFADVMRTIKSAREHGLWISINLLLMPGLTDQKRETEALAAMINEYGVNMVQLRNLNIDPDWLFAQIGIPQEEGIGVPAMIALLKEKCPHLRIGCHNPSREEMDIK
ncbi:radical SAM protein [bacterium]|nr:radical SAM protein [bacterium]